MGWDGMGWDGMGGMGCDGVGLGRNGTRRVGTCVGASVRSREVYRQRVRCPQHRVHVARYPARHSSPHGTGQRTGRGAQRGELLHERLRGAASAVGEAKQRARARYLQKRTMSKNRHHVNYGSRDTAAAMRRAADNTRPFVASCAARGRVCRGRGSAFDVRCAVAPRLPSLACLPRGPRMARTALARLRRPFVRLCVCFARMSRRRRSAGRRSRDEAVRWVSARAATVPTHPSIARAASSRRASEQRCAAGARHARGREARRPCRGA